jgi:hypothetical protein
VPIGNPINSPAFRRLCSALRVGSLVGARIVATSFESITSEFHRGLP